MKTKESKKIGESVIIMLGGILISNFYSFTALVMSDKWMPISEMVKILNDKGAVTSIITVEAFHIVGNGVVVCGLFSFIKQIYFRTWHKKYPVDDGKSN